MPMFERVTIIGVGLLGASLGLALRRRGVARRVIGVGRAGSDSLAIAQDRGAIDEAVTDAAAGVASADVVILATPVGLFPHTMQTIAPALKAGAIVNDVGSTKTQVMAWAAQWLPGRAFVGSHPMAGSEKTGPANAKSDLYENALCLICPPTGEVPDAFAATEKIEAMWRGVGMRTLRVTAADHDRMVAAVSHLPHAAAFALAAAVGQWPDAHVAAAGGYCDTTRVAGSDITMWRDIYLTNGEQVVNAITGLETALAALKAAIAAGDGPAIEHHLVTARKARAAVLLARAPKPPGR